MTYAEVTIIGNVSKVFPVTKVGMYDVYKFIINTYKKAGDSFKETTFHSYR